MLDSSKIDKILNNFFENEGFECVAEMDTDFAYWYANSTITYSLIVSERMDRMFLDFAQRKGLKVDCGIFILSLFHELGHHETIDELEDEEMNYCLNVKRLLGNSDEECETYFNLLDEISATEWAIDYINNNINKVEKLAIELQKEIENFYKKYQIEH